MMKNNTAIAFAVVAVSLAAFGDVRTVDMESGENLWGAKELPMKDIPYVTNGDAYRMARCKLDLRIPSETGFPTVVWFHGGGLTGGGRHFLEIDRRIGIVAADYRLMNATNGVQGTDCIEDAAAAVAWTMKHIAEYGGDTNKVFVSGISAGGYLTMMVGMAPAYLAKHGFRPTDLAGIVPISGQATKHFAVRKFAGDEDPQYVPKIDELAPLRWTGSDLPPILDICGEPPYEWKCRSEENRLLVASCVALGHKNARFVECPFCDHGRTFNAALPYLEFFVLGRMPKSRSKQ